MTPLIVFVAALIVSALVFPAAIGRLARARMGQQIREEGPAAHHAKAGTPTAGGLVFLLVALVLYLVADRSLAGGFVLIALALGGGLGFVDDYAAIRGGRNLGLKARYKIVIQLATGALLGVLALRWGLSSQLVPFDGRHAIGNWMILVSALAVAAGSNAFNLTDGSDGLAAGAGAISFGALALVAVLQHQPSIGLLPAILAGSLVGPLEDVRPLLGQTRASGGLHHPWGILPHRDHDVGGFPGQRPDLVVCTPGMVAQLQHVAQHRHLERAFGRQLENMERGLHRTRTGVIGIVDYGGAVAPGHDVHSSGGRGDGERPRLCREA